MLPRPADYCYRSAVTHRELQAALDGMEIGVDAAEAHGWLCGALCVREDYDARAWAGELADDAGGLLAEREPAAELSRAHEETLRALLSPDFHFVPLLPEDEEPLRDRVAALAAWCGGFLYGIGTGGAGRDALGRGEMAEYLRDIGEIARVDPGEGETTEADESDYVELCEYVKAGAQLAFEELSAARTHAQG
jgi:uncharacterized protein